LLLEDLGKSLVPLASLRTGCLSRGLTFLECPAAGIFQLEIHPALLSLGADDKPLIDLLN
jgi:hypothetical protein